MTIGLDSLDDGALRAMNNRGVPLARVLEEDRRRPQGRVWPGKLVAALAVDALRMLRDVLTVCHSAATGI